MGYIDNEDDERRPEAMSPPEKVFEIENQKEMKTPERIMPADQKKDELVENQYRNPQKTKYVFLSLFIKTNDVH